MAIGRSIARAAAPQRIRHARFCAGAPPAERTLLVEAKQTSTFITDFKGVFFLMGVVFAAGSGYAHLYGKISATQEQIRVAKAELEKNDKELEGKINTTQQQINTTKAELRAEIASSDAGTMKHLHKMALNAKYTKQGDKALLFEV